MTKSKPHSGRPDAAPKPGRTPRRTPERTPARSRSADRAWPEAARAGRAWTGEQQALFLEVLADGGTIDAAVVRAGRTRASAFAERVRDPAFALAWDEAAACEQAMLEARLIERAIAGLSGPADAAAARDAERVAIWILGGRAGDVGEPARGRGRGRAVVPGGGVVPGGADPSDDIARADALLAEVAARIALEEEALLGR